MLSPDMKVGSPPPLKKAVAFVRLAPDLAAKQRQEALQQQQAAFLRFCDRHGYQSAATFADPPEEGQTNGPVPSGSAYARMRFQISQDGDTVAVAMLRLETLSEEPEERGLYLLELESLGAKVYLFNGQTVEPSSVLAGTWPEPAKMPVDVGGRIKSAMRNRAIRGEGLGKPPYGYRIGPNRKLEVVPVEAETVRLIYSLYTQKDQGIRLIVRHLNEHNILTRKGRNWSMVTIRDILRNRAYLGTYSRFGMRVPGSHTPIITPDTFRWTQDRLEERTPSRKAVQAEPFLLSGLIYCDACANRMMGVTRRQSWTRQKDGSRAQKEYRYYQCQSRTNQGMCSYQTQNAAELEAKVLEHLREQRDRLAAIKSRRTSPTTEAATQRERRRLLASQAKVEARLKRNIRQIQAGKLSLLKFRPLGGQLLQSRREMLDRLDALADSESPGRRSTLSPAQAAVVAIDELLAAWQSMDFQRKRELVSSLVERIGIKDEHIDIALRAELQA